METRNDGGVTTRVRLAVPACREACRLAVTTRLFPADGAHVAGVGEGEMHGEGGAKGLGGMAFASQGHIVAQEGTVIGMGAVFDEGLGAVTRYMCAVADISAAIYSSAGSYTTAGSDIVLPPRWKLLGPFEAVEPEC